MRAWRFDVGFYAGQVFGLIGSSLLPIVLLVEAGMLHARLSRAHEIERGDRARELRQVQAGLIHISRLRELGQMVSAPAHEVNKPLTAVGSYLRGALRLIRASGLVRADHALQKASDQVTRASQAVQVWVAAALAPLGSEGPQSAVGNGFFPRAASGVH